MRGSVFGGHGLGKVGWLWLGMALLLLGWQGRALGQTGTAWTLRNPLPTNENLHAAAWSGSRFVVVGNAGTVLVSPDGVSWAHRASGVTTALNGVTHTGGQFVAVGDGGLVLTSPDGNKWTKRATSTTKALRCVVWTGTTLVALGDDGTALTSLTGVVWTTRFTGTSLDLLAAVWTGSKVQAVGELGISLESATGVAWAQSSQTPALSFTGVAWDGAQLVASTSSGTLHTSPNGVAWTQRYAGAEALSSVIWTGGTLVACGSGGTLLTSPDALTWTPRVTGVEQQLLGLAQGAGTTLAVGATGALLTSPDTALWTDRSTVSHAHLRDIAWTGLKMAAVGLEGEVLSSTDGVAWVVESSGVSADLHGVVWAGDKLVAVGAGGTVLTSVDGVSWLPHISGTAQDLLAVEWTRDAVIAVGAAGVILTSPDGITWAPRASGTIADLRGVVWNGTRAVAVGTGTTICVSDDGGVTWSPSSVPPGSDLNDIAWSGGVFCAVGDGDLILTSANGTSWTQRTAAFAQNLRGITWVAGRFVAVGTSQLILTSTNGVTWTRRGVSSVKLPTLHGVRAFRGLLVAVGDGGDILTNGSSPTLTPVVNFTQATLTVGEEAGVVNLGVQLSFAPASTTKIPFTLSGTTARGADFTVAASPLVFPAGQSFKNISFTLRDDALVEAAETLIATLGTPAAALAGTGHRFTLTVLDNDEAPFVIMQPMSQLVELGEPLIVFSTEAFGSPTITYQWRKNGAAIAGATGADLTLLNARLSQAGRYSAIARNPTGSALSDDAELGVVDTTPGARQVPLGGTATFTISAAGNGLSFQWRKNFMPLSDGGRISGAESRKLVISSVEVTDADIYDCEVTGPGGLLSGGLQTLSVLQPPVVNPVPLPSTMVGGVYTHLLTATNMPTRFSVSGLPRGLSANLTTGQISGRAQVAGNYNVVVSAMNAAGTSPFWVGTLVVQSIPAGAVGSFQGQVARHSLNGELGGRIDLTTTTGGMCSGRITLGGSSYGFSSRLDTFFGLDPQFTIVIPRGGNPALQIDLTLQSATQTLGGTVNVGGPPASISGWRQAWNAASNPASVLAGYYSLGLDIQGLDIGEPGVPQGTGFMSCTVGQDGRLTFAGKMADGAAVTTSTFLGSAGQALIYQPLYANTGSVLGVISLTPDAGDAFLDNTFSGSVSWLRKPQPLSTRLYQAGFGPLNLAAHGKYLAADSKSLILGLPAGGSSAQLLFASGGVEASATNPDVGAFTYTSGFAVVMPAPGSPQNPAKATLSIEKSTGLVGGRFILSDGGGTVIRNVRFEGMIIRPAAGTRKAFGFFTLPQLPNPATGAILSGQVVIDQPW